MKKTQQLMMATALIVMVAAAVAALAGCKPETRAAGFTPREMADALFAVMSADRAVYTKQVVNRLQNEEGVIKASEHWKDDKALPLPAQMFRMGAEAVTEKNAGFTYALLSLWPINKQNEPKTDFEKTGLKYVADTKGASNYYTEEVLGGTKYFTAVYPDVAVSKACVSCHNAHPDSPRDDFALDEVMGGIVLRIPVKD
jgi:hypothetical protein